MKFVVAETCSEVETASRRQSCGNHSLLKRTLSFVQGLVFSLQLAISDHHMSVLR